MDWLIWLVDWFLIIWLIDCWLLDWLIDWLIGFLITWSFHWLIDRLMTNWSADAILLSSAWERISADKGSPSDSWSSPKKPHQNSTRSEEVSLDIVWEICSYISYPHSQALQTARMLSKSLGLWLYIPWSITDFNPFFPLLTLSLPLSAGGWWDGSYSCVRSPSQPQKLARLYHNVCTSFITHPPPPWTLATLTQRCLIMPQICSSDLLYTLFIPTGILYMYINMKTTSLKERAHADQLHCGCSVLQCTVVYCSVAVVFFSILWFTAAWL